MGAGRLRRRTHTALASARRASSTSASPTLRPRSTAVSTGTRRRAASSEARARTASARASASGMEASSGTVMGTVITCTIRNTARSGPRRDPSVRSAVSSSGSPSVPTRIFRTTSTSRLTGPPSLTAPPARPTRSYHAPPGTSTSTSGVFLEADRVPRLRHRPGAASPAREPRPEVPREARRAGPTASPVGREEARVPHHLLVRRARPPHAHHARLGPDHVAHAHRDVHHTACLDGVGPAPVGVHHHAPPLHDEDRVLGLPVAVGDVGLLGLEDDEVHLGLVGAGPGPGHEPGLSADHRNRHPFRRRVEHADHGRSPPPCRGSGTALYSCGSGGHGPPTQVSPRSATIL